MTIEQLKSFTELVIFGRADYIDKKGIPPTNVYVSTKAMDFFDLQFPLIVAGCKVGHSPFIEPNVIMFSTNMYITLIDKF